MECYSFKLKISLCIMIMIHALNMSYIVKLNGLDDEDKKRFPTGLLENIQILRGEQFKDFEHKVDILAFKGKSRKGCSRFPKSNFYLHFNQQLILNQKLVKNQNLQFC